MCTVKQQKGLVATTNVLTLVHFKLYLVIVREILRQAMDRGKVEDPGPNCSKSCLPALVEPWFGAV